MSNGTDDDKDSDKITKAKAWCVKARELIGYGLVGQSRTMYLDNEAIAKGLEDLRKLDKPSFDRLSGEYTRLSKLAKAAVKDKSDPQVRALIDQLSLVEAQVRSLLPGPAAAQLAAQKDLHARSRARAEQALLLLKPARKDLADRLKNIAPTGATADAYAQANVALDKLLVEIERARSAEQNSHHAFALEAKRVGEQLVAKKAVLPTGERQALAERLRALVAQEAQQRHASEIDKDLLALKPLSDDIDSAVVQAEQRLLRKKQLLAGLVKLVDPAAATAADRQALKDARDAVGKALAGELTSDKLDAADKLLQTVQAVHLASTEVAAARQAFLHRLAVVAGALKAADRALDGDSRTLLLQRLATAQSSADVATKKAEFDALRNTLDTLDQSRIAALAFNQARDAMLQAAVVLIQLEGGVNVAALEAQRDATLLAATNDAKAGLWPAATLKLANFRAALGGDQAKFDAIGLYAQRMAAFDANDLPILKEVRDEKAVPGWNQLDNEYAAARKKGTVAKTYAAAVADLDTLALKLPQMQSYGALRREVKALTTDPAIYKPPDDAAIDNALQQGDVEATNKQWPAARGKLTTLRASKPALTQGAAYGAALAAVKKGYDALQLRFAGTPMALALKASFDAAATDAGLQKYTDAALTLTQLRAALPDALAYLDAERAAAQRLDAGHGALKAALLKPAADKAITEKKPADAVVLLAGLHTLIDAVDAYQNRLEEVTAIRAALPATDTARLNALDELLLAAAATAGVATDGTAVAAAARFQQARARLDELKLLPDFEQIDADLLAWRAALAQATKLYTKVHARLSPPPAKVALADALAATRKPAETTLDYAASLKLLPTLQTLVQQARDCIDARETALAMAQALAGIAAGFGGAAVVYVPVAKDDIDERLVAADKDAAAAKFKDAADKYRSLLNDCRLMCANAARRVEAASYGRGHSMGRHAAPPDVNEAMLVTRVTTGRAPDGAVSKTESATQFDDPACWLETREQATEAAKANSGGKFNPAVDKVPWADPLKYEEVIEHPKPVGSAVLGLKEKPGLDAPKGRLEGAGTFESTVTVKGLTRTMTIFSFLLFNPKRLWEDGVKELDPKFKPVDWKAEYDGRVFAGKTVDAYLGEWILLTQYPLTEGWDPEKGEYTTPL